MIDLPPLPKLWTPPKPAIVCAASLKDLKVAMPLTMSFAVASVRGLRPAQVSASVVATDNSFDASDLTTYSFASQALGEARGGRIIVIAAHTLDTTSNNVSSATIGGVSASIVGTAEADSGGVHSCVTMAYAVVPTGETGTIAVTWANGTFRCHIGVWAIYDALASTPHDSGTATGDPSDVSGIDVPAGGVAIAAAVNFDGTSSSPTFSWTNVSGSYDVNGEGTNEGYSGACAAFDTAQSGITITADPSAASACAAIAASWG